MGALLVLLLGASVVLVGGPVCGQEPVPVLKVGEKVEGKITEKDAEVHTKVLDKEYTHAPARGKSFRVPVDTDGAYTIDLRSYLFDAYLVLRNAEANVPTQDDDGLLETHARLVVQLEAGKTSSA